MLTVMARAEVCVRPVFPFGKEEPTKVVLAQLAKHHISAQVCSDKEQQTEIYFYPLQISLDSGESFFYVSAQPTTTGVIGTVSNAKISWNSQVWVVSVHPWGEEDSIKRQIGFGLKSQIGAVAKWINKKL